MIEVYTGDGKGKTTAAIGLAIRAIGHALKVCYIYFHKDPDKWGNGEYDTLRKLGIEVFGFAKKHPHFFKDVDPNDIRRDCLKGLRFVKKIYKENKYNLLILDEINISLRDGFLKEEEILEILEKKPKNLELVLTGRDFPESLVEKVDLVSEIKNIKHPYNKGIKGRKGIEY